MAASAAAGLPRSMAASSAPCSRGELADGGISLHQLGEAQQDLSAECLVRVDQSSISRAGDDGAMEAEIGLHDRPLRGPVSQSAMMRERTARSIGHRSTCRQAPCRLDLDRRAQLVDLAQVLSSQRTDEESAVARLDDQPAANQSVERRAKRVPTDLELLGEADLAEMLPRRITAVKHLSGERGLERVDSRGRSLAGAHGRRSRAWSSAGRELGLRVRHGTHPAHVAHAFTSAESVTGRYGFAARAT